MGRHGIVDIGTLSLVGFFLDRILTARMKRIFRARTPISRPVPQDRSAAVGVNEWLIVSPYIF